MITFLAPGSDCPGLCPDRSRVGAYTPEPKVTAGGGPQNLRGMLPFDAGLYTLPMAAMTMIFAPLSGRIVDSRGPRP